MFKLEKRHNARATLIVFAIIAISLFFLWRAAVIRSDSQPSFLPGPIWLLRFESLQRYTGLNAFVYKALALFVTMSLIAGVCAVAYFRKPTWAVISTACLILWVMIGILMQQVIALTVPLEPIVDQPRLPRVLLIGDSISIGYTLHVRQLLSGRANVHRANTNCGSTEKSLRLIDSWLADGNWDVIHFNWGLHDVKSGESRADDSFEPGVSLEAYEQNLNLLVLRLKRTGASLIWATTTPVMESYSGIEPESILQYNRTALHVMSKHDILINDLYEFANSRLPEIQPRNDIHFTFQGYRMLAGQVVNAINRGLDNTRRISNEDENRASSKN